MYDMNYKLSLSCIMFQTQSAMFSTACSNTETQMEEEHKEERKVNEDVQLQLSSKVTTTEASLELRRHSDSNSR